MKDQNFPTANAKSVKSGFGGPKSPQGKQRSRFNALKIGIFAKNVLSAEPFHEQRSECEKFLTALQRSIHPVDGFEQILVVNLGLQFLRLSRIYKADAELAPFLFQKVRERLEGESGEGMSMTTFLQKEEVIAPDRLPTPDLLIRYEKHIWSQISRILDELERWRRIKKALVLA